jgi:hypothetical protein
MAESHGEAPAPRVRRARRLALAIVFSIGAVFQLAMAHIVEQPGVFGELARVVQFVALLSAFVAVAGSWLSRAYWVLWLSAACLVTWVVVTWIATLGP